MGYKCKIFVENDTLKLYHRNILSQTYNTTLFSFDYFYVNAQALSNSFHSINSSFNQAANHAFVLTICLKLDKKQLILSMKGGKKK